METRYGLMDIGSNTIHAVIYELDGQKWKKVLSEKEYAELISYVEEQTLSEAGIERLCQAVESLRRLFQALPCVKTCYFATCAAVFEKWRSGAAAGAGADRRRNYCNIRAGRSIL